jgi:tetratricopeptide (TPR) repeat protein
MRFRAVLLAAIIAAALYVLAKPRGEISAEFVSRAKQSLERKECESAIAYCNKALAINPNSVAAFVIRAQAWHQMSDYDSAVADLRQALAIAPNDKDALNNLGVQYWKMAKEQDRKAERAEAAGDTATANDCRQKCRVLKDKAIAQWSRGITPRPMAIEIHGNDPYTEDLEAEERRLANEAKSNPRDAKAHLNYGRILLRRSLQLEQEAQAAENGLKAAKTTVDSASH